MFVLLFAYVFGGAIDAAGRRQGLPRVPDRRHLRPDRGLRRHHHRRRPGRGHAEGHHRPVPVAADGAVRRAGRAHPVRRRSTTCWCSWSDVPDRPGRRLADPHLGARGAAAASCCCCCSPTPISLDHGLDRHAGPTPEVVNNAAFIVIFPLTFVANTFVPLAALPGPLRAFAEWNPVSAVTQAARELFGNTDRNRAPRRRPSWALQHAELYTRDLGGRDPRRLRAAGQLAVPARGQPLTSVSPSSVWATITFWATTPAREPGTRGPGIRLPPCSWLLRE